MIKSFSISIFNSPKPLYPNFLENLTILAELTSAFCEAVADVKIVKLISQIADSYKILLAILFSVSIMFIIGITLVLKITNSSLMYR